MAAQAPASIRGFGEQDPGTLGQLWVAGGLRDQFGEPCDDSELLVAVEGAGILLGGVGGEDVA
jgi:hypothetical protein